jgi:hypothetical protein
MKTQDIDRDAAPVGWAAWRDARDRNIANASRYPDSKKAKAEGIKFALELVYSAKDIYVNYRKNFIAVKVDSPIVKDRKGLADLESHWEHEGITKLRSKLGVVYRIPA